jgi:hypothetical protein
VVLAAVAVLVVTALALADWARLPKEMAVVRGLQTVQAPVKALAVVVQVLRR